MKPMPGEMKKDDMMKEEVMKGAKEKGKVMKDALQKEGAPWTEVTGSQSQSNKHRSKPPILQFNHIQEITMGTIKSTALGLIIACTFTLPALAADTKMKDGAMMMMTPDGKMMVMDKPDQMMSDMMMKEGKPMAGNMMMMMHRGKMMMMEDEKMDNGKMMSDMTMKQEMK